jgi:hypothetical protein
METAVMMAIAMGRTLVLPPEQKMYLLGDKRHKNTLGMSDFFHFDSIQAEHKFKVISFEEFLETQALTGKLTDQTGNPLFPPQNETNWNGMSNSWAVRDDKKGKKIYNYLYKVSTKLDWNDDLCLGAFPSERGPQGVKRLEDALQTVLQRDDEDYAKFPREERRRRRAQTYNGHPTPVNASLVDRMSEVLAERNRLCIYNESLQNAKLIHATGHGSNSRLLVHFYAMLFFEDWEQDLWTKRFVRDHLRYHDEIQCAAARVVEAVQRISREKGDPTGSFDSFHIRRGDFQYKQMHLTASEIYHNNTAKVLRDGRTVYIATDERKKEFFEPLRKHYNLLFLDDFQQELGSVNTNYYGMIDQLVAARGQVRAQETLPATYHFIHLTLRTFLDLLWGFFEYILRFHQQNSRLPRSKGNGKRLGAGNH